MTKHARGDTRRGGRAPRLQRTATVAAHGDTGSGGARHVRLGAIGFRTPAASPSPRAFSTTRCAIATSSPASTAPCPASCPWSTPTAASSRRARSRAIAAASRCAIRTAWACSTASCSSPTWPPFACSTSPTAPRLARSSRQREPPARHRRRPRQRARLRLDPGVLRAADGSGSPNGGDAVYVIEKRQARALAQGRELHNPSGLAADGAGGVWVTDGDGRVYRLDANGSIEDVTRGPGGALDGIALLGGRMFVTERVHGHDLGARGRQLERRGARPHEARRSRARHQAPSPLGGDRRRVGSVGSLVNDAL